MPEVQKHTVATILPLQWILNIEASIYYCNYCKLCAVLDTVDHLQLTAHYSVGPLPTREHDFTLVKS